jgi:LuxR family maltose regulon positive regulatory protein
MPSIEHYVERREQDSPPVLVTKLRPPTPRAEWVVRQRLFERLRPEPGVRLTVVVAPAGSGKTTLLGTWVELEAAHRPVAWVSLDDADDDPLVLWSHVLEALRRVCPALEALPGPERVGPARMSAAFLPALVNGLSEQGDAVLILDDFHRLHSGASREGVAWLAEHAPPSFQLVVSTRTEPALGLAALRAHGELLELRAAELGFSADEADMLLNDRLELGLTREDVDELVERTEGWSAGLYLAALSLRGAEDRHTFVSRFGGSNRHVVDFFVGEVLEGHDPALETLMLRCSILERLSGPLCDALLDQDGSGEQLTELARTNLFLVPLDDHGQWYRFHHLFRQLLRVELEHREPDLAPTLHRRASAWHRDHGSIDDAIEHTLDAGSFAEAGDLICARWIEYANLSRHSTVLEWLRRFPSELVDSSPALLAVKAWILSLCGMRDEAAEAMAAAERLDGLDQGPLPDGGSSVEASIATLKATLPWGDVGSGYENAVRAAELEQPESPYWPMVCWATGMGQFFRGDPVAAEPWFAEATRLGPSVGMWIVTGSALAYQSLIAGEQGDVEQQRRLAEASVQLSRERGIAEIAGAVPLALGADSVARGELEPALPLLEQSVVVLRAYGQPLELAHALIRQARVLFALGERDAAAAAIAEARATVDSCRDPGVLEQWLTALETRPRARPAKSGDELSKRELVVLRALTGPLSERDIARELYLSHSTIHSHTKAIYRKLGVSSRSEAISQARKLGLLSGRPH